MSRVKLSSKTKSDPAAPSRPCWTNLAHGQRLGGSAPALRKSGVSPTEHAGPPHAPRGGLPRPNSSQADRGTEVDSCRSGPPGRGRGASVRGETDVWAHRRGRSPGPLAYGIANDRPPQPPRFYDHPGRSRPGHVSRRPDGLAPRYKRSCPPNPQFGELTVGYRVPQPIVTSSRGADPSRETSFHAVAGRWGPQPGRELQRSGSQQPSVRTNPQVVGSPPTTISPRSHQLPARSRRCWPRWGRTSRRGPTWPSGGRPSRSGRTPPLRCRCGRRCSPRPPVGGTPRSNMMLTA